MAYEQRREFYEELETVRNHPLVVYITSDRKNAKGQISSDAIRELLLQLHALPANTEAIDLLIVSEGGDPTVAWRIVSLIREQVRSFNVLIPQAAYSAATLIALGADEIVMHPHGNLGPTDPQISGPSKDGKGSINFGSEDLGAFLKFAKEEVGLSDQGHLLEVLSMFCDQVGAVPLGVAARSSQLSISMGEKLLRLHMNKSDQRQEARVIAEKLTKDFFHHGYPVNRTEAEQIGLKIAGSNKKVESLMWKIWCDVSDELQLRKPFIEMEVLKNDPNCAALFAPIPVANIPPNLPANAAQQLQGQVQAQIAVTSIPPSNFELIHAIMESHRMASRFVTTGMIFGSRNADMQFNVSKVHVSQSWNNIQKTAKILKKKSTRKKTSIRKTSKKKSISKKVVQKKLAKKR